MVKRLKWNSKLKGRNRAEAAALLKNKDCLNSFMAHLRVRHTEVFETVQPIYKEYTRIS